MTQKQNIKKPLNKKEFEKLFKIYFKPLTAFAKKYTKDVDNAKEIVHDVFLKLWEKRDTIDLTKAVKSYLYTSVNNKSLNFIRDNKKFQQNKITVENINENEHWNYSDNLIAAEIQDRVNETLNNLPEKCRKVFMLSRYEDMKYKEIAKELNISIKTVENHISKALKILRKNLAEYLSATILFILKML